MSAKTPTLPEGFQTQHGIAWGSRRPGLLEISYWNLKRKNSITGEGQRQMGRLVNAAQDDPDVKVIFIHGGLFYSSGNDLSVLAGMGSMEGDEKINAASFGVEHLMLTCLRSLLHSKKPVVGLIRGQSIGIGFTTCAMFDFLYCTPEAQFSTPFMRSFQSPEGGSTQTFVQQFGLRRANEILLLDRPIKAQEAVQCGFANGIIEDLNNDHWPDLDKIPAIVKLLDTDYRTLVNCKELINAARDNARLDQTLTREAKALVDTWMHEDFPPKLMKFMQSVMRSAKPKL